MSKVSEQKDKTYYRDKRDPDDESDSSSSEEEESSSEEGSYESSEEDDSGDEEQGGNATELEQQTHQPANFAPTPEERTFETNPREAEERQQQLLEEINTLAEEITIRTPELQNQENDSSDPSDSEDENTEVTSMATKQKLSDPPKFDGTRSKLRTWIHQLDVKINGNIERFPDDNIKISYTYELLQEKALKWAEQYIDKATGAFTFGTYTDFKEKITNAWGDLNPKATAEEAIRTLRQGKNDCTTYYTEFTNYVYELDWDNEAKIAQFKYGLNQKIIEKMIGMENIPETFEAFANKCIKLDNELRSFQQ